MSGAMLTGTKTFFSGDVAGRVVAWSLESGEATPFKGAGHTNQASAVVLQGDTVVSAGMDDAVRFTPVSTGVTGADAVQSPTQPRTLAAHESGVSVLVAVDNLHVIVNGQIASTVTSTTQAFAVAIAPSGAEVAVGQTDAIQFYSLANNTLTATDRVTDGIRGQVVALAYSPDGAYLAAGDTQRQVILYDAAAKTVKVNDWVFHQARITSLGWAPSSKHVVSGSIDTHIFVWSVDLPSKRIVIKNAHVGQVRMTKACAREMDSRRA